MELHSLHLKTSFKSWDGRPENLQTLDYDMVRYNTKWNSLSHHMPNELN